MIRYVKHSEIDKQRWDDALEKCINPFPYAYSWYLDKVTNYQWDALILDDYSALFPLPFKKKFFLKVIYQPFFTQQLGLFASRQETLNDINNWLKAIPVHFVKTYLHLNSKNSLPNKPTRLTHQVLLNRDYSYIYNDYSSVVTKNLKRIRNRGMQAESSQDVYSYIKFMKDNLGPKLSDLSPSDIDMLQGLLIEILERKKGFIRFCLDKNGNRIAGTFIIKSNARVIYLLAASTQSGKKANGMTYLIDNIMTELAGKEIVFDFEGSMIPGIAKFNKNFGGKEEHFPVIQKWL